VQHLHAVWESLNIVPMGLGLLGLLASVENWIYELAGGRREGFHCPQCAFQVICLAEVDCADVVLDVFRITVDGIGIRFRACLVPLPNMSAPEVNASLSPRAR